MTTRELIDRAYVAFNQRDIDGALALMSEDVSWPKASEGGRVVGKREIREYWTRQWAHFDPKVDVLDVVDGDGGTADVKVHQLVRDLGGRILSETDVWHVYTMANGLIGRMDIKEGDGNTEGPSAAFAKRDRETGKIAACLWFDGKAEDAARFYARTFPNSGIDEIVRSPAAFPNGEEGDVLTVEFTVFGMPFVGLNGGPDFSFDEAVSFQVFTDDQAETDTYWHAIVDSGGSEGACGWCKDAFGLSWQIVPRALMAALKHPDRPAAKRAMEAMMRMKKIEIATIEAGLRG